MYVVTHAVQCILAMTGMLLPSDQICMKKNWYLYCFSLVSVLSLSVAGTSLAKCAGTFCFPICGFSSRSFCSSVRSMKVTNQGNVDNGMSAVCGGCWVFSFWF